MSRVYVCLLNTFGHLLGISFQYVTMNQHPAWGLTISGIRLCGFFLVLHCLDDDGGGGAAVIK